MQLCSQLSGGKILKLVFMYNERQVFLYKKLCYTSPTMSRRRYYKPTWSERLNLSPHLSQGLVAVLLCTVASLSILSFFSLAGVVGTYIDIFLSITFGQVRYVFPILLIVVAILLIKDLRYEYRPTHFIGSILFFIKL
jgi:membrane-bound ClpP family serine protease